MTILPAHASAVRSAAGHLASKTSGFALAAMSGTLLIRAGCAPIAFTSGLRRSAYRAAAGRRIRSGMQRKFAGVTSATRIAPVMSEQFWIHAATEAGAKDIENKLANMRVGSKSAIHPRRDGASIFAACPIKTDLDPKAVIEIADSHRSVASFDMFYQIDGTKSGMHHPDGILWIRDSQRQPCVYNEKYR